MDEVAPYGAVKSGFLKVRGRMRSVPCEMLREGHNSSTFRTVLDVPGLTTKFDAIEDDLTGEDPASEPLSIFLLGIAPMWDPFYYGYDGLILYKAPEITRIGCLNVLGISRYVTGA
jgi:hypothetical protein